MSQITFLAISALLLLSTVSLAYTGNDKINYKGEMRLVSCPCILNDGIYLGVSAGYDSYRIDNKVTFVNPTAVSFSTDPILNASGPVGGAFLGYGLYFWNFHHTYLGLEFFGNGSAAESDNEITQATTSNDRFTRQVKIKSNYGISLLPGIKLSHASLFYIRFGYNWSHIDVVETFTDDGLEIFDAQQNTTTHGFNYGVGIESAFFDDFSVRAEYVHASYNSFYTRAGTKISPTNNQFMASLIYHFV